MERKAVGETMLSVGEIAEKMRCSTRWWLRLANSGRAPRGCKIGRLRRWRLAEVDAWLVGGCRPVHTEGGENTDTKRFVSPRSLRRPSRRGVD